MPQKLSKIFRPRSVAVIGASIKQGSVGRTVFENLKRADFPGDLYPVNPRYDSLLNLRAYRSVGALPTSPDSNYRDSGQNGARPGPRVRRGGHFGNHHSVGRVPRSRAGGAGD